MNTRAIPCSGEPLPVIGLGTWQTFDVGSSARERDPLREVLRDFVSAGGTLIDSSPMYGKAEAVTGDLTMELGLQSRLFVATKVWTKGRAEGIRQMQESLRRLRATSIDLMHVHNLVDARVHLDTLRGWKADGRVRYVGVTHYRSRGAGEIADLLATEAVDFIQINYSAVERDAERRLLPLARDRAIAVIANRPLGGEGGGVLRGLQGRPLPWWAAEIACTTWAQLLLKFVVSNPAITCAIPATSNPAHLRENVGAGTGPMPDEAMRARIAAACADVSQSGRRPGVHPQRSPRISASSARPSCRDSEHRP
jgi:diketogulonate reductase-like aldo/keto reductase